MEFVKGKVIIFVNSISCMRKLTSVLRILQLPVFPLHANMQQKQRLKNMDRFTSNTQDKSILVATDVASRGIDIPEVDYVIHYQIPRNTDLYVHRSGRTARAKRVGASIMLVSPPEKQLYQKIVSHLGKKEDSIPSPEVDLSLFPAIKDRVSLALKIDTHSSQLRKVKTLVLYLIIRF
jgi:ATP-dependent RNA helicase DDX24/MAK5